MRKRYWLQREDVPIFSYNFFCCSVTASGSSSATAPRDLGAGNSEIPVFGKSTICCALLCLCVYNGEILSVNGESCNVILCGLNSATNWSRYKKRRPIKNSKNHKRSYYPTSQRWIINSNCDFTVFDPSPLRLWINCSFYRTTCA